MKGSPLEGKIAELFRGRFRSYVRGVHADFSRQREEEFYDLSMQVRSCARLEDSFEKYIDRELLDGDNQYNADDLGKQDVYMGVEFVEFPPVLQLHLRRFEYSFDYDRNMKLNDRFEFPASIDLEPYLAPSADRSKSLVYDLHAVLVHSGDVSFGHYYAFIRTSAGPQWFEFNDTRVTKVTPDEAIAANFGGHVKSKTWTGYSYSLDQMFSAYILVYVRHDDAPQIFEGIPDEAIPQHVKDAMDEPDETQAGTAWQEKTTAKVYDVEESIRHNTLSGAIGSKCAKWAKEITFADDDTHATVY
jgi:ubiquitin carboxyl-terminal hydrolase 7